jgi:hypothetical protein
LEQARQTMIFEIDHCQIFAGQGVERLGLVFPAKKVPKEKGTRPNSRIHLKCCDLLWIEQQQPKYTALPTVPTYSLKMF